MDSEAGTESMVRRRFLKKLGLSLFGVAAVFGIGVRSYLEIRKQAELQDITPEEIEERDDNLSTFVKSEGRTKLIGVDHDVTERAFYEWLARNSDTVAQAGITKIFIEMNTAFAPLFQNVDKMDSTTFVRRYLGMYPRAVQRFPQ